MKKDKRARDSSLTRILALPCPRRVILDHGVQIRGLIQALSAVNIERVYALGEATPKSGYLLITQNFKTLAKPPVGYDVLWIPSKVKVRPFSESLKALLVVSLRRVRGRILKARFTASKYSPGYEFIWI
jgi:hypothetical protein